MAAADGGFFPTSWGWSAAALAWVAAAAVLLSKGRLALGRLELVSLCALAGLSLWIACSLVWTASVPLTALEVQRSLVPLAGLAAALFVPAAWAAGVPAGVAAAAFGVALWNLVAGGDAPVGYVNGVALLAAVGALLTAGWVLERRDLLALAALPALAVLLLVVHRSEARAVWPALAGGAAVAVALRLRRPGLGVAAAIAVGATALLATGVLESEARSAYWRVALAEAGREPLLGAGAGTWGPVWLEERDAPFAARDAHSLYLETLSELGPLGLALVLAALVPPLVAAVRVRRQRHVPAVAGAYATFVLHLGVDWDWELTGVALAGILLGAALLVAARGEPRVTLPRPPTVAVPAAVVLLALGGLPGNALVALADERLGSGDWRGADRAARRAARLAPWASEPWRLRGEAERALGRPDAAAASFLEGLERDARDVELWRALARVARGEELRRARARAAQLDPLAS